MDDRRKLELLAGELLSYLPQPRQASSLLAPAGLAASRWVPCGTCGARGRVTDKGAPCAACVPRIGSEAPPVHRPEHGCLPCGLCGATGWRKARKGDRAWDEYVGAELPPERGEEPVGELLSQIVRGFGKRAESEARELALRRVEATLARWRFERGETDSPGSDEAWLEQRRRLRRSGSFKELEQAIAALREKAPNRVSLWWRVFVLEEKISGPRLRERLDETTDMLLAYMPAPIRLPKHLEPEEANAARKDSLWRGRTARHADQRAERDLHMVELWQVHGWKKSRIARFYGVDRARVTQIIDRQIASGGVPTGVKT